MDTDLTKLRLTLGEKLYELEAQRVQMHAKRKRSEVSVMIVFGVLWVIAVMYLLSNPSKGNHIGVALFIPTLALGGFFLLYWEDMQKKHKQSYNKIAKQPIFEALCGLTQNTKVHKFSADEQEKVDFFLQKWWGVEHSSSSFRDFVLDDLFTEETQTARLFFGDGEIIYKAGKSISQLPVNFILLQPPVEVFVDQAALEEFNKLLRFNKLQPIMGFEKTNIVALIFESDEKSNYDFSMDESLRDSKSLDGILKNFSVNRQKALEMAERLLPAT